MLTNYSSRLGKKINENNLADGLKVFSNITKFIAAGKIKSNSVILFDELETNLHTKWQIPLCKVLIEIAKYKNRQFHIATHSSIIIEALSNLLNENTLELIHLKKQTNSKIKHYNLKIEDSNELLMELGDAFLEIYRWGHK